MVFQVYRKNGIRWKTSAKLPHWNGRGMNDGVTACVVGHQRRHHDEEERREEHRGDGDQAGVLAHGDQESLAAHGRRDGAAVDLSDLRERDRLPQLGRLLPDGGHRNPPPW